MSYGLGVDLGTTFSAAAVSRGGRAEIVELGQHGYATPSVVHIDPDGRLSVGEAANRLATSDPTRVGREFKRRFGDATPLLLGGSPYGADALTGMLFAWIFDQVSGEQAEPPRQVVLAHPANWRAFKTDLLVQSIAEFSSVEPLLVTEPEAAVLHYASEERVAPGSTIGVYDLGGGTFDAAIVHKHDDHLELLGTPRGIERLGGVDFDEAVFAWARRTAGVDDGFDGDDPLHVQALWRLRSECVVAKEALSVETEVDIPVILPHIQTQLRLTRSGLESMIRPALDRTVRLMRDTVESADLTPADLDVILLVGGSSRIPLVSELLNRLGRPLAIDTHPKHAMALGAALLAEGSAEQVARVEWTWDLVTHDPNAPELPTEVDGSSEPELDLRGDRPTTLPDAALGERVAEEPGLIRGDRPTTLPDAAPGGQVPEQPGLIRGDRPTADPGRHAPTVPGGPPAPGPLDTPVSTGGGNRRRFMAVGAVVLVLLGLLGALAVANRDGGTDTAAEDDGVADDGADAGQVLGATETTTEESAPTATPTTEESEPTATPTTEPTATPPPAVVFPASPAPVSDSALLFTRRQADGQRLFEIAQVDVDTGEERILLSTPDRHTMLPVWSPDRRTVVYSVLTTDFADWSLFAAAADGSEVMEIDPELGNDARATWAWDGSAIAYVVGPTGDQDLMVLDLQSGARTALMTQENAIGDPAFSPTGDRIMAWRTPPGGVREVDADLVIIDIAQGTEQVIELPDGFEADASWHPAGDRAVIARFTDTWNLFVLDIEAGTIEQITDSPLDDQDPAWSPDGSMVAFSRSRDDGGRDILIVDPDDPAVDLVAVTDSPIIEAHPAWATR